MAQVLEISINLFGSAEELAVFHFPKISLGFRIHVQALVKAIEIVWLHGRARSAFVRLLQVREFLGTSNWQLQLFILFLVNGASYPIPD